MLLYYRKHHGGKVWLIYLFEYAWTAMRVFSNKIKGGAKRSISAERFQKVLALMRVAWRETDGGRISPPRPW
jgi:hypothetical protein